MSSYWNDIFVKPSVIFGENNYVAITEKLYVSKIWYYLQKNASITGKMMRLQNIILLLGRRMPSNFFYSVENIYMNSPLKYDNENQKN